MQVEESPNAELQDNGDKNCKTQSNYLLNNSGEYGKKIKLCKDQLVTYDHDLDKESSIKQGYAT